MMVSASRNTAADCFSLRWITSIVGIPMVLACLFGLDVMPLRLNLSSSVPSGLYLAHDIGGDEPLHRGTLVAVCLPTAIALWGRARGYLHRGSCSDGTAPVGKPIFAIAGDTVTVSPRGLGVRGNAVPHTAALARDSNGRLLLRVPDGQYAVLPGQVWLVSAYSARSWDSRYFGPVPVSGVVSALSPLWMFSRSTPMARVYPP